MKVLKLLTLIGLAGLWLLVAPTGSPAQAAPATQVVLTPLRNITAIAAGYYHTCALTTTGGVKCWGRNDFGQLGDGTTTTRLTPVDVSGLDSGVTAITAGGFHTCALTAAGGVKCWGRNETGQLGDGTTTTRLTPVDVSGLSSGVTVIAAGGFHTCALTAAGGVKCWGANDEYGQLGDGTMTNQLTPVDVFGLTSGVTAITTGGFHTCALTATGWGVCWGNNGDGQLGDGTKTDRTMPTIVSGPDSGVAAIVAGEFHTCVLTTTGGAKCWGYNAYGQLGDGTTVYRRLTPVDVNGLDSSVTAIAAGGFHTCALTAAGGVKCWGDNSTNRGTPTDVGGLGSGVTAITAGMYHTCALTAAGGVKCWGDNDYGQLGDGTTFYRPYPANVSGLDSGITAIAAGWNHTCALTAAGGVKCWGLNGSGQLGDGTTTRRLTPTDVSGLDSGVTALAAGSDHTCALTATGGVKCWGDNGYGQLGDGTTAHQTTPVAVSGLDSGVTAIAAGGVHTCALTTAGGVKCWGYNKYGQLGDGTATSRLTPVEVSGLDSGITAITAGWYHTCALTTAGGVECWGYNGYGQLGDGTATDQWTPVAVSGLDSGVTAIAAGGVHTCALTTAGGVKCWGYNYYGQLGDGTTTDQWTPVAVSGLDSDVTAIAARELHTCALTTAGGVKCWGYNYYGQLGDGTTTNRPTPVGVSGLDSDGTAIAAGEWHTCALTAAGGVKCWGYNYYGQLGDGTASYRLWPTDVVTASEAPLTFTISGQALDSSHTPMAGVTISAGNGLTTTTTAGGYYTVTGLISGTYTLTPTLSGYAFTPLTRTISVPPDWSGQDFTAAAITYTVTGRVIRDGGALANVVLVADSGITATTDSTGNYTVTGLISGTYTLTPTLSGYAFTPLTRTISVPPDRSGQDFNGVLSEPPTETVYLPLVVKNN